MLVDDKVLLDGAESGDCLKRIVSKTETSDLEGCHRTDLQGKLKMRTKFMEDIKH